MNNLSMLRLVYSHRDQLFMCEKVICKKNVLLMYYKYIYIIIVSGSYTFILHLMDINAYFRFFIFCVNLKEFIHIYKLFYELFANFKFCTFSILVGLDKYYMLVEWDLRATIWSSIIYKNGLNTLEIIK